MNTYADNERKRKRAELNVALKRKEAELIRAEIELFEQEDAILGATELQRAIKPEKRSQLIKSQPGRQGGARLPRETDQLSLKIQPIVDLTSDNDDDVTDGCLAKRIKREEAIEVATRTLPALGSAEDNYVESDGESDGDYTPARDSTNVIRNLGSLSSTARYPCSGPQGPRCSMTFSSQKSARRHYKRVHGFRDPNKLPNNCPGCGNCYPPSAALACHRNNCAAVDAMLSRGEVEDWERNE